MGVGRSEIQQTRTKKQPKATQREPKGGGPPPKKQKTKVHPCWFHFGDPKIGLKTVQKGGWKSIAGKCGQKGLEGE